MAEDGSNHSKRKKSVKNEILQGRYEINELLGAGKFAKVYHASNIMSGQIVAIKVIDKKMVLMNGLRRQIKQEIECLRRVRHPNIVQIFEVMATKAKIYIVMEYVSGGELFEKVTKGRLTDQVARKYFQQLISAVGFCHSRGVFHRDLKPENLLLSENGDLKVTDFGLGTLSNQVSHTFCGTPAYLAPEVLILTYNGYQAAKADIWSCGVILFVLMAGYYPFGGDNVRALDKGEFRCPRWFSSDLTRLLSRLLDANPKTRITIPEIMENRWFRKGFRRVNFYFEDGQLCHVEDDKDDEAWALNQSAGETESELESEGNEISSTRSAICHAFDIEAPYMLASKKSQFENPRNNTSFPKPANLNAFHLISFSRWLDLSRLFEENEEARFLSHAPVSEIISKLDEIAKVVKFTVRKKGCAVTLQGSRESVSGPLVITAEIFELAPSLLLVELKRKGGDREEYERFFYKELQPRLQYLVREEPFGASHLPSHVELRTDFRKKV